MRLPPRRFLFWSVAIGLLGVSAVAYAILPAIGLWMLSVSGGSLLVWDIGIGVSGVLAGMFWADCTYQITSCQDPGAAQALVAPNDNKAKKPLTVDLRPTASRKNPDPKQFNDAVSPSRGPSPKATYQPTAGLPTAVPGNYGAIVQAIGGEGSVSYAVTNGMRTFTSTLTRNVSVTYAWQGSVSINGASAYYYVLDSSLVLPTLPGYTKSGSTYTLTDASQVKKPATTPCEAIWDSAAKKMQFDAANPNCDGLESQLVTSDGKIVVVDNAGAKTSVAPQSSGGFKVTKTNADGSWKSVDTAPYDAGQGGYPIVGSSSGSTPSTNPDPGTPGGTGTGGTGTGNTGTGTGGDCAGYGCAKETTQQEVLTSVKEITKAADPSAVASAYDSDAKAAALVTDVQGKFKTASDYSGITSQITANLGLPPGGQCSNAVFNWSLMGRSMVVDFQWMCVPIAPIVNWFFWMLITIAAVSEVLYILTGRGLPGDNIDAGVTDQQAADYIT